MRKIDTIDSKLVQSQSDKKDKNRAATVMSIYVLVLITAAVLLA